MKTMGKPEKGMRTFSAIRVEEGGALVETREDVLAEEVPMELNLLWGPAGRRESIQVAVTMRTPGMDFELAIGFLYSEGIIHRPGDILRIRYTSNLLDPASRTNAVQVELHPGVQVDTQRLERHFYTSSSCGVCGKASMELVRQQTPFLLRARMPRLRPEVLLELPGRLQAGQRIFQDTGGIHAVGLFDTAGQLLRICEDVGRHNALDKLIGFAFRGGLLPLSGHILLLSGRISFEMVQKALMAGIPVLAAVGAPSSLALELAEENGMTLIGFLRQGRFNIYTDPGRIVLGTDG